VADGDDFATRFEIALELEALREKLAAADTATLLAIVNIIIELLTEREKAANEGG
jgi:hypothetical protein